MNKRRFVFIVFGYLLTSLSVNVTLLPVPLFAVMSCPLWDVGLEKEEFFLACNSQFSDH